MKYNAKEEGYDYKLLDVVQHINDIVKNLVYNYLSPQSGWL